MNIEFLEADESTTRQYGGTGLGLAICTKIVNLMGGNLQVKSQEGKGSTFYFAVTFEIDKNYNVSDTDLQISNDKIQNKNLQIICLG